MDNPQKPLCLVKEDIKGYILYDPVYLKHLESRIGKFIELESRLDGPRGWEEERMWSACLMGTGCPPWK